MNVRDYPVPLRPYVFHGVNLNYDSGDKGAEGECPFCGGDHFYADSSKGLYKCGTCYDQGNVYNFIQSLYEHSERHFDSCDIEPYRNVKDPIDQYARLIRDKGFDYATLGEWGIIPSYITFDPLVPMFNHSGSLSNLCKLVRVWHKGKTRWRPFSTPGLANHPFRHSSQRTADRDSDRRVSTLPPLVSEGLWDSMAIFPAIEATDGRQVLGIPGVSTIKRQWFTDYFPQGFDFVFDNDYPRRLPNGQIQKPGPDNLKIVETMAAQLDPPPEIRYYNWGPSGYAKDLHDGYDVEDMVKELGPAAAYERIKAGMSRTHAKANKTSKPKQAPTVAPTPAAGTEPILRTSFKSLLKDYEDRIHVSGQLRDTLVTSLAVVVSTGLPGDQLWFRIIGPPGSGKTTIVEAVSYARDYVFPTSILTGFHSGYIDNNDREADNSLIAKMDGKTTIIKDGDTLLRATNLDRILSELRDLYDGVSRARYRNTVTREYEKLQITFLLCGTDSLRELNRSDVGERFLDCEIFGNHDTRPFVERSMWNTYALLSESMTKEVDTEYNEAKGDDALFLKRVTAGFINHLRSNMLKRRAPEFSEESAEQIRDMATFLAYTRARHKVDRETKEVRKSRVEIPTRLVAQLTKYAFSVALVLEKKSIDEECLRLVRKCIQDTGESTELEMIHLIAKRTGGQMVRTLAANLGHAPQTITKRLHSMQRFGLVTVGTQSNNSGQRGRDVHMWKLTDKYRKLYLSAYPTTVKAKK